METNFPYQKELPNRHIAALVTVNTIISLINIAINSFLCFAIFRLKLLKTISYRLVLFLTISDLCIATIEQPLATSGYLHAYHGAKRAYKLQLVIQFGAFSLCQFSGIMIVIMAIDRYLHMKYLNRYNTVMSNKRAYILISINLLSSLMCGISYTLSSVYGFFFYMNTVLLFIDLTVLLSSFFIYLRAFMTLRSHVASSEIASARSQSKGTTTRRADLQFMKGILLIMLSLSFCYMPYFILGIYISFLRRAGDSVSLSLTIALYWTMEIVFLAPSMNALIFFMFSKKLKDYLFEKIKRRQPETTQQMTSKITGTNIEQNH